MCMWMRCRYLWERAVFKNPAFSHPPVCNSAVTIVILMIAPQQKGHVCYPTLLNIHLTERCRGRQSTCLSGRRLTGFLSDWLTVRLVLAHRLRGSELSCVCRPSGWLACWLTEGLAECLTDWLLVWLSLWQTAWMQGSVGWRRLVVKILFKHSSKIQINTPYL